MDADLTDVQHAQDALEMHERAVVADFEAAHPELYAAICEDEPSLLTYYPKCPFEVDGILYTAPTSTRVMLTLKSDDQLGFEGQVVRRPTTISPDRT